jgi:hypothetical protein
MPLSVLSLGGEKKLKIQTNKLKKSVLKWEINYTEINIYLMTQVLIMFSL